MGNEKFLSDIRDALETLTSANPYYDDIPIVTERKDIAGTIDQKLATVGGIAMVLVTPSVGKMSANTKGAYFEEILLVGRVMEHPKINKTGKEALAVAMFTAALWNMHRPDEFCAQLSPAPAVVTLGYDPRGFITYDVMFSTAGGIELVIPKLATPTLDIGNPAAVTLAQATPGAAIFYTTDGKRPSPRGESSSLYLAPFVATSGTTIRARAWLAGYNASAEVKATIP